MPTWGISAGIPSALAWFALVLPSLVLNYLGQGALLLVHEDATHPFFQLAPSWALLPLVGIATAAAIIASQALISGSFSITRQAMQLGLAPRLDVEHTSAHEIGQIYVPQVNWALMVCHGAHRDRLWLVEQPCRRLRHRRHAHDGDHRAPALRDHDGAVALEEARGRGGHGVVSR